MYWEKIKEDNEIISYIKAADKSLAALGYTEHGVRHTSIVSSITKNILVQLKYDEKTIDCGAIAGLLHDIGNIVNREHHAQTGATIAHQLLLSKGLPTEYILSIISAIGNHHEEDGYPISPVSAALILADKSDVHKSRVRNKNFSKQDIHDRVNYAVKESYLRVLPKQKIVKLELSIDIAAAPVLDYFEIFLSRMIISKKAAKVLGCDFKLEINGNPMA